MRKTWKQKLNIARQPVVVTLEKPFAGISAGSKLLIATPREVKRYIDAIPCGSEGTVPQMRKDLSAAWGADCTCPTSTGIFVRIVSEEAMEAVAAGASPSEVTPFWRIIDEDSLTARKLAAGVGLLREMRHQEGLAARPILKETSCIRPKAKTSITGCT